MISAFRKPLVRARVLGSSLLVAGLLQLSPASAANWFAGGDRADGGTVGSGAQAPLVVAEGRGRGQRGRGESLSAREEGASFSRPAPALDDEPPSDPGQWSLLWLVGGCVLALLWRRAVDGVLISRAARGAGSQAHELNRRLDGLARAVAGVVLQYRQQADGRGGFPFIGGSLESLFGIGPEHLRRDRRALLRRVHPHDRPRVLASLRDSGRRMQPWQCEFRLRGTPEVRVSSRATVVRELNGSLLWHVHAQDVTRQRLAEEENQQLAFYDALTGLPNRRLLMDRLRHALASVSRGASTGALLFIDLDNFKRVNERWGYERGDQLLQEVAARLQASVRGGDTVGRVGSDEFVVILEGLDHRLEEGANGAELAGEKVLAALSQPYPVEDTQYHGGASIGIMLFGRDDESAETLMQRVELAMYQAKDAGPRTLRFFDPDVQAMVAAHSALENEMRLALQREEFVLHYQPQYDGGGALIGLEALVRWQHPQRGLIGPDQFIPLAESSGLIEPLGDWVLRTACRELATWPQADAAQPLTVAVNVSARQFRHADFVASVLDAVHGAHILPAQLKLEITESLLLEDVEAIIACMERLRRHGVRFSMDDFGTGYSSLAYLKRLPLDQLKIDRSFVRDVLTNPNDAAITRTVIALGQILGLHVVAEGVESEAQRTFLAEQGCHAFQGFWTGRPAPMAALAGAA